MVLTKQTSLLSWPRFTCHFDLLSPTHLILMCQTRVCFGRNKPRATPGRGHITDCDSADGTLFPFLIWAWRWLWSCQLAYLSEDGTDKVTTSVSSECVAGRPSRFIFNCHVHSSQRGHIPTEWDMANLFIFPQCILSMLTIGASVSPFASFPLYGIHLEELKLLLLETTHQSDPRPLLLEHQVTSYLFQCAKNSIQNKSRGCWWGGGKWRITIDRIFKGYCRWTLEIETEEKLPWEDADYK